MTVAKQVIQQKIKQFLGIQLITVACIVLCNLFFVNMIAAYSALLGGGIVILVTTYFNKMFFKNYNESQDPKQVIHSFIKAEVGKVLITLILLFIVFKMVHLNPISFFIAFIVTQLLAWLTPLLFKLPKGAALT